MFFAAILILWQVFEIIFEVMKKGIYLFVNYLLFVWILSTTFFFLFFLFANCIIYYSIVVLYLARNQWSDVASLWWWEGKVVNLFSFVNLVFPSWSFKYLSWSIYSKLVQISLVPHSIKVHVYMLHMYFEVGTYTLVTPMPNTVFPHWVHKLAQFRGGNSSHFSQSSSELHAPASHKTLLLRLLLLDNCPHPRLHGIVFEIYFRHQTTPSPQNTSPLVSWTLQEMKRKKQIS